MNHVPPENDYVHEMHQYAGGHVANYSQPNIYGCFFNGTLIPSRGSAPRMVI